jgi:hypothetical protein
MQTKSVKSRQQIVSNLRVISSYIVQKKNRVDVLVILLSVT